MCQSVTDLAMEQRASIDTKDFRTPNRCLDDTIAEAVTEHAREHNAARHEDTQEFGAWLDSAMTAFEVLQTGRVGIGGSTGALLKHSLAAMRAVLDRRQPPTAERATNGP